MVRDSVQLETAVNTITHEYLLEVTSEYGISEVLRPELPGPRDRIVDFLEGKCVQRWDAGEWYLFCGGCEGAGYVSYPIQKQPKALLCLVGISHRYYLGDDVDGSIQLNTCSQSNKGEDREPHGDGFIWSPSAIEKSPLDFADEAEASVQETAAPEVSPPEEVPVTTVPGGDQAAPVVVEPPPVQESRKRGREGIDANAPPKSLRRDHADLQPSVSSRGGKSLAAMQLCLASNIFLYEGVPADVSDPDPLSFADALSPHPADVIRSSQGVAAAGGPSSENVSSPSEVRSPRSVGMGSQLRLRFEQEAKLLRKSVAQVDRREQRIQARESEIKNLEVLLEAEADMKRAAEEKSAGLIQELEKMRAQFSELQVSNERLSLLPLRTTMVEQRCAKMDARLDAMSIDFDEELYPHMLTAIAGRRWVIGHGLRLATMKCPESLEMRQAFADVVSAGIAKGMTEGLKHGDDTGDDAPQFICDMRPNSSQLAIPVYPEVRDPRNPWACIEEIKLADAIAANIVVRNRKREAA
nr:hypothetical protein [Tanacetum cinerariifolium]